MSMVPEPRVSGRPRPTHAADDQPANPQGQTSGTPARLASPLRVRRLAETLLTAAALVTIRRLGLLADTPLWVFLGLIALGVAGRGAAS